MLADYNPTKSSFIIKSYILNHQITFLFPMPNLSRADSSLDPFPLAAAVVGVEVIIGEAAGFFCILFKAAAAGEAGLLLLLLRSTSTSTTSPLTGVISTPGRDFSTLEDEEKQKIKR